MLRGTKFIRAISRLQQRTPQTSSSLIRSQLPQLSSVITPSLRQHSIRPLSSPHSPSIQSSLLPPTKKHGIDTDTGGDPDDVMAKETALNSELKHELQGITTTHTEPEEKAKIAKLVVTAWGYPDIPVFAGIGAKRTDSKEEFLRQCPLFSPDFGYPNPGPGEKKWYEMQAVAYRQHFPDLFEKMKIENESAPQWIVRMAKYSSPQNKFTFIALGPLHNFEAALKIDPSIANNIRIFSMGGLYPKGYNWLISPETTAYVLSRVETICISNQLIVENNLFINPEELKELESLASSAFGKAFIADVKNWHKGDAFKHKVTYLYDPVTVYLAQHPEEITALKKMDIKFPCLDANGKLKPEFRGRWYYQKGLENQITQTEENENSNVAFVTQVRSPEKIKSKILEAIKTGLSKGMALSTEKSEKVSMASNTSSANQGPKLEEYYNTFFYDPANAPASKNPEPPEPKDDYYNNYHIRGH